MDEEFRLFLNEIKLKNATFDGLFVFVCFCLLLDKCSLSPSHIQKEDFYIQTSTFILDQEFENFSNDFLRIMQEKFSHATAVRVSIGFFKMLNIAK